MRKRTVEWIVIIGMVLLFFVLCIYVIGHQDRSIRAPHETEISLSAADGAWLDEHETISIYVEPQLQFLIGGEEGGYLQQYLQEVLKPVGIRPNFVTEEDTEADAGLYAVTSKRRQDMQGKNFTSPLFQMEGALFVRRGEDGGNPLRTVVLNERMSAKKLDSLSYQGHPLQCETTDTVQNLVALAEKGAAAGMIGDRSQILNELRVRGLYGQYVLQEKTLYSCNACLITEEEDTAAYDILNQCIHGSDRHDLSFAASEAWLDGDGPVFMRQDYRLSYLPVLIIILSVLIAFFVYYLTNRSMYEELGVRMDKITESRNELQTTFHGVGHYMAELSPGGEITDLNRAFAENTEGKTLHRRIWDVLELDGDGPEQLREMVEAAAAGRQPERLEASLGRRIFVIDIFPLEDARGAVTQLLFMAIEVTEERMAKRQMLQDNKMIAIGQLAAGVAHEIRNPLGIIRNYCYVLKTMEDEEVRAKAIEEIEKAVETSGSIINNLLDFSRVSPGRREEIDVEQHVRSILALNESTMRSANIELKITCEEPIRTYMSIEPFDMILLNLVKNAMDAITESGTISITLTREENAFAMAVADTGVGIEEDALDEIFNPFYTTKGNKGTGLGLYIVYNETEKLDGDIEVSSRKGEGTTFTVRLPIRREEEQRT